MVVQYSIPVRGDSSAGEGDDLDVVKRKTEKWTCKEVFMKRLSVVAVMVTVSLTWAYPQAQELPIHFMDMNFQMIRTLGQTTAAAVIVPMCQIENHGLHLPVGTDFYCTMEIARKTAEICGAVVGVPLTLGNCVPYASWPGYVMIDTETLMKIVKQYLRSMQDQGFKKIAFLIMHAGDNFNGIKLAVDEYTRDNPDMSVAITVAGMLLSKEDIKLPEPGIDIDTSIMLQVKPELVHVDKLAEAQKNRLESQTKGRAIRYDRGRNLAYYRPDNYIDASKSTAGIGRKLLEILSTNFAEIINDLK